MINLLNEFKVKGKYCMTSFRCFYCWLWSQSKYQRSVSTFNFKQVSVSSVRKASYKVLKKKKAIYLYRNKSCKPISINNLSLHQIEISYEHYFSSKLLWQYFSSKFALGIPSVLLFGPVIWSAISLLFHREFNFLFFFCFTKPKTYLNHWNKETNW